MKSSGYNLVRDDTALLDKYKKSQPSFSVQLYPLHWTLNYGPKFLYTNQVSSLLDDIRAFRIPADFLSSFDEAKVPYYDGCMIVEILNFRPQKPKDPVPDQPDAQRVVLRPTPETLWADVCLLNQKAGSTWTDRDALEVEARILVATSHPLCLEPDPQLTRIVNSVLRVSTPNVPNSLKRKAAAMADLEEDETEKAKRTKLLQFMNPQTSKPSHTRFRILELLEKRALAPPEPPRLPQPTFRPPSVAQFSAAAVPALLHGQNGTAEDAKMTVDGKPVMAPTPSQQPIQLPQAHILQPFAPPAGSLPPSVPSQLTQPASVQPHLQSNGVPEQVQRIMSPAKQMANAPSPHRPPSRALSATQPSSLAQPAVPAQPNSQSQQQPQPLSFQPQPIAPNFLRQPPPVGKRKNSQAQAQLQAKPPTPASLSLPLPSQPSQAPPALQPPRPQSVQSHHPSPNSAQLQQPIQPMQPQPQMPNPTFMAQNRPISIANHAQRQLQAGLQSGRSTPIATSRGSPNPNATARSPMISNQPLAGRNSPMISNQQQPRGSPLVANQPIAARNVAMLQGQAQQQVNQQPQQLQQQQQQQQPQAFPIQGAQRIMNSNYALQLHAHQAAMARLQAQAMNQSGAMAPQQSQPGQVQPQAMQDQSVGRQPYPGTIPMHMFSYPQMPMTMNQMPMPLPQQYFAQMGMGRGVPQIQMQMPQMQNGQQPVPSMQGMTMQQMQGMGAGRAGP